MLPSACGLGVDVAGQDDRVQDQPSGEGRDPSNGRDDILASVQHEAAVDHDPEEVVVGPHGNLLHNDKDDQPANRSGTGHCWDASVAEVGTGDRWFCPRD
ncbi:MAG TPA: hypothetical protein VIJ13_02660, partial [Actinomycetota bacterium]